MKMKKLERDLPKFLRAQRNYIKEFEDEEKRINDEAAKQVGLTTAEFLGENERPEEYNYTPQEIESLMFKRQYDYLAEQKFEKY